MVSWRSSVIKWARKSMSVSFVLWVHFKLRLLNWGRIKNLIRLSASSLYLISPGILSPSTSASLVEVVPRMASINISHSFIHLPSSLFGSTSASSFDFFEIASTFKRFQASSHIPNNHFSFAATVSKLSKSLESILGGSTSCEFRLAFDFLSESFFWPFLSIR